MNKKSNVNCRCSLISRVILKWKVWGEKYWKAGLVGGQTKNVTFLLFACSPRIVAVTSSSAIARVTVQLRRTSLPAQISPAVSLSLTVPSWSEVARNPSSSWRTWRRNISTISSWKTCPVSSRKWRIPLPDWTRKLANYIYTEERIVKNISSSETASVEAWPPTLVSPWSSASPGRRVSPLRWKPFWSGASAGLGSTRRSLSG